MNIELKFENLVELALVKWPKDLNLKELQQTTADLDRYSVKGLGLISDGIEEKYIGKEHEIIWCELHDAVYEAIHGAAKFVTRVELSQIRKETIRIIFERRLKKAASSSELNWKPEDFALVEAYFSQNL